MVHRADGLDCDRQPLTAAQASQLGAALIAAADQIDSLT